MSKAFRFGDISEKLSIFDSLESVMSGINWRNELGLKPDPRDIDLLCDYYRSGDLQKKWPKTLAPSSAKEIAVAKHMVRKIKEHGSYMAGAAVTSADLAFKRSTVERYYNRHREHAQEIVEREDLIEETSELLSIKASEDDAFKTVAADHEMAEWELRMHYDGWKKTFPHPPEYYRSSEYYDLLFGKKIP